jgi:hypothetical protein
MKKILLISITLLFNLSVVQAEELAWTDFNDKFKAGEIELNCRSLACAAKWGANRTNLRKLDSESDWYELAELTAKLNQNGLLAYYYLAKSAIMLGLYDAADMYIDKSTYDGVDRSCILGTCEGIDINDAFLGFRFRINKHRENEANGIKEDSGAMLWVID